MTPRWAKFSTRKARIVGSLPLLLMFVAVAVGVVGSMLHFSSGKDILVDILVLLIPGPILAVPICVILIWAWIGDKRS
jgi:hypothetical protein